MLNDRCCSCISNVKSISQKSYWQARFLQINCSDRVATDLENMENLENSGNLKNCQNLRETSGKFELFRKNLDNSGKVKNMWHDHQQRCTPSNLCGNPVRHQGQLWICFLTDLFGFIFYMSEIGSLSFDLFIQPSGKHENGSVPAWEFCFGKIWIRKRFFFLLWPQSRLDELIR